jgi:uncharacterized protein YkwD
VRETSKLLHAALLTVLVLLAGAAAQTAMAHVAGKSHHRKGHVRRGAAHRRASHARPQSPKAPKAARGRSGEQPSRTTAAGRLQAASAAATIASVLATPCQNTELTPEAANVGPVREAILCLVNRVRAEHSLAPLKTNGRLQAAAEGHDTEMIQLDYFAHIAPSGETPVQRIEKTGYIAGESEGYVIGENLAWGTYSLSTPKSIVAAWVASPGHLANILESRYTETGVGVTAAVPQSLGEGSPGALYAQEFGVIVH